MPVFRLAPTLLPCEMAASKTPSPLPISLLSLVETEDCEETIILSAHASQSHMISSTLGRNAVKRLVHEVELPHNVPEGFSTLTTAEPPEKRATGYAS